jgi:hypothetical protein
MPADHKPLTPADMLGDGLDGGMKDGIFVRKGSIASFIRNSQLIETLEPGTPDYEAVAEQIREIKPALDALEVFTVFDAKVPAVREILGHA